MWLSFGSVSLLACCVGPPWPLPHTRHALARALGRVQTVHLLMTRNGQTTTAVALSGGGSRAYVAGVAQLAALEQLGLISSVDHVAGVSGGAWATAAHSFSNKCLPQLLPPEALTWSSLRRMPDDDVHGAISRRSLGRKFLCALAARKPPFEAWRAI